jgi:hypothetical protein
VSNEVRFSWSLQNWVYFFVTVDICLFDTSCHSSWVICCKESLNLFFPLKDHHKLGEIVCFSTSFWNCMFHWWHKRLNTYQPSDCVKATTFWTGIEICHIMLLLVFLCFFLLLVFSHQIRVLPGHAKSLGLDTGLTRTQDQVQVLESIQIRHRNKT